MNGANRETPTDGMEFIPLEAELVAEKPRDHPVWGVIITLIVCGTVLLSIQMLVDYHW